MLRDVLDGVRVDKSNLTINDLYSSWLQLKRGLKDNTFANYKYMYTMFVEPDFGKSRIVDLKRSDVRGFYNYLADERNIQVNAIDSIHVSMCRHTLLQCIMWTVLGSLLLLNRGKDEASGRATKMKRWQSTDMSPKEPLMHTTGRSLKISSVSSVRS